MNKYTSGFIAGFIATLVLSALMFMKDMMGLMPDVDIIAMLASKMGGSAMTGWVAHFMIGTIGYGLAYAVVFSALPFGGHMLRGALLGVAGWFMMMMAVMPMMGAGLFGLAMPSGMMVPVATLMLHLIFGAALGLFYGRFQVHPQPQM